MSGLKVISFSLWGNDPKYLIGAVRNAELTPKVYPGWRARFYVGWNVPLDAVVYLEDCGAQIVVVPEPEDFRASMWRFRAASDPTVEIMISRDCDSRLGIREAEAVKAWLASDREFHIMRDHPGHSARIMAGMWGVRTELLRDMRELLDEYNPTDNLLGVDQRFLDEVLYPHVKDRAMVHDEIFSRDSPFPTAREGLDFVGQVFDEQDKPSAMYARQLASLLEYRRENSCHDLPKLSL